jgi:hypothetical protein
MQFFTCSTANSHKQISQVQKHRFGPAVHTYTYATVTRCLLIVPRIYKQTELEAVSGYPDKALNKLQLVLNTAARILTRTKKM